MYKSKDLDSYLVPTNYLFVNQNIGRYTIFTAEEVTQFILDKYGKMVLDIKMDITTLDPYIYPIYVKTELYETSKEAYSRDPSSFSVRQEQGRYVLVQAIYEEPRIVQETSAQIVTAAQNRSKRDELLSQTDWVETSLIVSDKSKQAMTAYRNLLRNVFEVIDVTQPCLLPLVPDIEFIYEKLDTSEYTHDIEHVLQSIDIPSECTGEWNMFLLQWEALGKTKNKSAIYNLLQIYCAELAERINNHIQEQ